MNRIKRFFDDLAISYKVSAISIFAVLCFLIFIGYQYIQTDQVNRSLFEIETVDKPIIELMDENFLSFIEARAGLIAASVEQDMDGVIQAKEEMTRITSALQEIKRINPKLRDQTDSMILKAERYLDIGLELAEGLNSENLEFEAIQGLTVQLNIAEEDFMGTHNEFRAELDESFNQKLLKSRERGTEATATGALVAAIISAVLILITIFTIRAITLALRNAINVAEKIAEGDRDTEIEHTSKDETGQLLTSISKMRDALKVKEQFESEQNKEQNDIAGLNDTIRGEHEISELGELILNYLAPVLNAQIAAMYLLEDEKLNLTSSYAFTRRKNFSSSFEIGENLVGQAAMERKQIVVENIPEDYIAINSGLGSTRPKSIIVTPIINDDELEGVLELGTVESFSDKQLAFLEKVSASIAVAVNSTRSRNKLREILEVTQKQADALKKSEAEMKQQQEELRVSNEELEDQAQKLKASEEHLQTQQEELRVINEELEEQTKALELQKSSLEEKNVDLANSQRELEEQSKALEQSSQYKSEFLSTMSHELRTPLNSILILSKMLSDNKKGNLEPKQVEHVEVIHSAGSDLLELINDILDLSKIEEGKLDFVVDSINLKDWAEKVKRNFSHVVADKGLDFHVNLSEELPEGMLSDGHRIDQVVKNMISNAMKFTENGSISINIEPPAESEHFKMLGLKREDCVSFSVKDTGIGIPKDKQALIFEAFQQADGTTSRKYGGTGLGLTISRQLSVFLGGDLIVASDGEGQGSTFSLTIPLKAPQALELPGEVLAEMQSNASSSVDMGSAATPTLSAVPSGKPSAKAKEEEEKEKPLANTLMIVEDDEAFSNTLVELAKESGFETITAYDGESALDMLQHKLPGAIILDVGLPGISGWDVMDKLKESERTKDIPVHFISGHNSEDKAMEMGAMGFLMKPVDMEQLSGAFSRIEEEAMGDMKKLLVIEDNEVELLSIEEMFKNKDTVITSVTTGEEAIAQLANNKFDCMIMDLDLPDINGLTLLETLNESEGFEPIPVIVYTAKDLMREEEAMLRRYASRIILKAGESSERLLNEVSLFLHWLENNGEDVERPVLPAEGRDDIFQSKRVLVVDDDMRNIYSLSAVLEGVGLECVLASNGIECLESLEEDPNVDCILMDIMMPEMDGYETMQKIREQEQFQDMPIIALTAKAMKDDKKKCIDAGANDYITKPLDTDKLLSLLRVWLSQKDKVA
jgi:CheY-like chemotaxis protein/putative methionine-R-sulfoxide reductase with GAF domain